MKCKVCGYEFDDSRNNCPMCGTPVESASGAPVEMKWNTRDFPKPQREVADIRMQWSTPEVSEGYITVPDKPRRQFSANNEVDLPQAPAEPVSPVMPVSPAAPVYTDPDALRVPRVEDGRLPEKFYTFQTKNEEFQRLLDKEFERLKELQSQLPESKSFPLPGMKPAAEDAPMDDFDKMLLDDTADSGLLPPAESYKAAEPAAPAHLADDPFDIQTLEQSIQLIREEEEEAQRESEARKRKLEAMKAARDAYFKSLDEAEAQKPLRGLFWRERETVKPEPKAAPAPKERENVHAYELPDLDDLTGSLTENPEHTIQFVKEDFIAAQDAMLREMAATAQVPEAPAENSTPAEAPKFEPQPAETPAEAPKLEPQLENAPEEKAEPADTSLQETVTLRYADDLFSELEKIYTGSLPASAVLKSTAGEAAGPEETAPFADASAAEEIPSGVPAQAEPMAEDTAEAAPISKEPAAPAPEETEPAAPIFAEEFPAAASAAAAPALEGEAAATDADTAPTAVSQLVAEKENNPAATQIFSGLPKEVEFRSEDSINLNDPEPAENEAPAETGGRHLFLKFLGLVILFLVLIQLAVFGLEKLLPDAEFTKTLVQIASSIQEACNDFFGNIAETVQGWFQ